MKEEFSFLAEPDAHLGKSVEPAADASSSEQITVNSKSFPSDSNAELEPEEAESYVPAISLKARLLDIKTLAGFGMSALLLVFFILTVKIDFAATFSNIL